MVKLQLAAQAEESNERSFFIVKNKKIICESQSYRKKSSSEQEHKVNALASGAEEGRDKLR